MELNFFSVAAFDKLPAAEREILLARFGDTTFLRFLDEQRNAAQLQLVALDPDDVQESSDNFRQRVRNATAIWRFWQDFATYTQQLTARSR